MNKPFGVRPKIGGELAYFGLVEWWLSEFSEEERKYIESVYQPLGDPSGGSSLTKGTIYITSQTAAGLLSVLAGWFKRNPEDRPLAYRILTKAEERAQSERNILSLHFTYQEMIQLNYRWRDEFPDALESAVAACRKQISIAPQAAVACRREFQDSPLPNHVGYEQLAIILEKQKAYSEAIDVCEQAESEGWGGDWAKRIQRLRKKLDKVK